MVDLVDGIILGCVMKISFNMRRLYIFGQDLTIGSVSMVDMPSSYSILVLMIAIKRINILAHLEEYDLGHKGGDVQRSKLR